MMFRLFLYIAFAAQWQTVATAEVPASYAEPVTCLEFRVGGEIVQEAYMKRRLIEAASLKDPTYIRCLNRGASEAVELVLDFCDGGATIEDAVQRAENRLLMICASTDLDEDNVSLEEIQSRIPDWEIEPGGLVRVHSTNVRGFSSMPIRFTPVHQT